MLADSVRLPVYVIGASEVQHRRSYKIPFRVRTCSKILDAKSTSSIELEHPVMKRLHLTSQCENGLKTLATVECMRLTIAEIVGYVLLHGQRSQQMLSIDLLSTEPISSRVM